MNARNFLTIALLAASSTALAHEPPASAPAKASAAGGGAAVIAVLDAYKTAMEKLDVSRTADLFAKDSLIYETGGVEGDYARYLEHHLTPELAEFSEFKFNDYKVEVRLEPPYAFATETYVYRIVVKADGKVVERQGVTSSVLRKQGGKWRILVSHNSSRALVKK